jgi:hypothetical protein
MWAADYGTSAAPRAASMTAEAAEPMELRKNALLGLLVVVLAAAALVGLVL